MGDRIAVHLTLCKTTLPTCHEARLFVEILLFPAPVLLTLHILESPILLGPRTLHHVLTEIKRACFAELRYALIDLLLLHAKFKLLMDIRGSALSIFNLPLFVSVVYVQVNTTKLESCLSLGLLHLKLRRIQLHTHLTADR